MSNNKIPIISFCCEYKVMSSRPEAVAEAGDVWEEMVKLVVLAVHHCPATVFRRRHWQVAEQWDLSRRRSRAGPLGG